MPEPLESELAGVEVAAPPQGLFPPGDVRRRPEAPGLLHIGQAAAVPTSGLLQVANEDPLFNFEFETGGGEALQPPTPSGPQTASTATAVGVVGVVLQHSIPDPINEFIHDIIDPHESGCWMVEPKIWGVLLGPR
jgi:hypothetical protein